MSTHGSYSIFAGGLDRLATHGLTAKRRTQAKWYTGGSTATWSALKSAYGALTGAPMTPKSQCSSHKLTPAGSRGNSTQADAMAACLANGARCSGVYDSPCLGSRYCGKNSISVGTVPVGPTYCIWRHTHHNRAAVCLHGADIAALRAFWTYWPPTETPFLPTC